MESEDEVSEQGLAKAATGLAPANIQEAMKLATAAASSGLFGVRTPEQALMILLRGTEMGLGPTTSFSAFNIINNRPCLSADAQVAVCVTRKDICEYFIRTESTEESATFETKRVGAPRPVSATFTLEDAKKAGLLSNQTWTKYRPAMLRHRAAAALAREVYPDLVLGLYTPEEMEAVGVTQNAPAPANEHVYVSAEDDWDSEDPVGDLEKRFDAATTQAELNECAKDSAALKLPKLSDDYERLIAAWKRAQARVRGGVAPKAEQSEDDAATAEIAEWKKRLRGYEPHHAARSFAANKDEMNIAVLDAIRDITIEHIRSFGKFREEADAIALIEQALRAREEQVA